MDGEKQECRLYFACTQEFIIVPGELIERLLAKRDCKEKSFISKEDIFPDGYLEYLERVLNANRQHPAFSYSYIRENPISETGIFIILARQLKALKIDKKDCFRDIRLVMYREGEVEGITVK